MQFTMTSKHHRKKQQRVTMFPTYRLCFVISQTISIFDMSQIQSTKEQMTLIIVLKLLSDIGISD